MQAGPPSPLLQKGGNLDASSLVCFRMPLSRSMQACLGCDAIYNDLHCAAMQTQNQSQQFPLGQLQTQAGPFGAAEDSLFYGMTGQSTMAATKQFMGADTQCFRTAQMKLHAREERLQVCSLFSH